MRNILILIIIFYILVLLQTSFLVPFRIFNSFPNLLLIVVVLINLFERQQGDLGIFSAFIGGFFLDIFSSGFFGFYIIILTIMAIFIKFILKTYISPVIWINTLKIKKSS